MKPCGLILTYMSRDDFKGEPFWVKVRTLFFNCTLFVGQLIFMIVGTAYGKIRWEKRKPIFADYALAPICLFGIVAYIAGITDELIGGVIVLSILFCINVILLATLIAIIRGIPWRRVWRAAMCSHVRLCLWKASGLGVWYYISFSHSKAEIKPWNMRMIDGKRFEYRDPTFTPSDEFMAAVIEYAEAQVGKRYDEVQLASPAVNFPLWLAYPPWWGQEKIKAFNRPGGLEYCISGLTACLRWAEPDTGRVAIGVQVDKTVGDFIEMVSRLATQFFKGYDTAVIPPCLAELSKNWRRE